LANISGFVTDGETGTEVTTLVAGLHDGNEDSNLVGVLVKFVEHSINVVRVVGTILGHLLGLGLHHGFGHVVHTHVLVDLLAGLREGAAVVHELGLGADEGTSLDSGDEVGIDSGVGSSSNGSGGVQKIYHLPSLKLRLTTTPLAVVVARMQQGRDLMLVM